MLDSILAVESGVTFMEILLCTIASLVLGMLVAFVYMYKNTYNKNFVITVALLPALVQSVILVVNGNLGTGIAVMGAFSLVRFRSAPGGAKEIISIFFAMAIGLSTGMGYILYAALFAVIISLAILFLTKLNFGEMNSSIKSLKVTIPEDLDYTHLFDDLFIQYAYSATLEKVRTTNMGSLYELHYTLQLKDIGKEKEFLDQIRRRNGNLTVSSGNPGLVSGEL